MALSAGTKAPDFTSKDQDGNDVTLSSLKGKKVVLYFYPRDMTSGCTAEACSLSDNYQALQRAGYEIFGVSTDDEARHRKFIQKEKLPFRLLADVDKSVHKKFGTWIEKSMYGRKYMGTARITYLIDQNGVIEDVIQKVDTRNHAGQILYGSSPTKAPPAKSKASKKPAKKTVKKKLAKKTDKKKKK